MWRTTVDRTGTLFCLTLLVAVLWPSPTLHQEALPREKTDIGIYERVTHRVERGDPYYVAAAQEQRAAEYPLKPFFTVRPPLLAWISAALGQRTTMGLAQLLLAIGAIGLALRSNNVLEGIGVAVLVVAGGFLTFYHTQLYHELWAGIFLTLGAAAWSRSRPELAAALVMVALCFREFAYLFAFVFGVFSLARRDKRGIAAWLVCGLLGSAYYAYHAASVAAVVLPGDRASQGWLNYPGLGWTVKNLGGVALFRLFGPVAPIMVVASLWGWLGNDRIGKEVFVFCSAFIVFTAVFARPDNYYWTFLLYPLLMAGLVYLPRTFLRLIRGRPSRTVGIASDAG